jgi:hypothetical protein
MEPYNKGKANAGGCAMAGTLGKLHQWPQFAQASYKEKVRWEIEITTHGKFGWKNKTLLQPVAISNAYRRAFLHAGSVVMFEHKKKWKEELTASQ